MRLDTYPGASPGRGGARGVCGVCGARGGATGWQSPVGPQPSTPRQTPCSQLIPLGQSRVSVQE